MKHFNYLFLLILFVSLTGFYMFNGGIKSARQNVLFLNHDPKTGFKVLQDKAGRKLNAEWNERNSTPTFVTGTLTRAGYSSAGGSATDGIRFITENRELFGLKDPANELKVTATEKDQLSMTHIKYMQMVNGIKLLDGELIVHFNSDGSVESVNGRYFPTPEMDTKPVVDRGSAIASAKNRLGISYKADSESAELAVIRYNDRLTLVYEVKLPSFSTPKMKIFVDAKTGSVIKMDDGIRYDGPANGTGVGLKGQTRNIHTYMSGGKYYLVNTSLPMFIPPVDSSKGTVEVYDAQNDTAGNGYKSAILVSDPNNDNNFNDNQRLKAAVDAHYYTEKVYNFYRSNFGRSSFDNKGGTMLSVVHFKDHYNNAFWNGVFMTYGNGDGSYFSDLAGAYDVIAHEITHGVINYSADLRYEMQSGALNESYADVFASLADTTNWLIGEDIFTPGIAGDALRNMKDPHNNASQGQFGWQPAHMDEFVVLPNDPDNDNGGVHINSGIPNKAFYNVASVIGHYRAGQIWYRSLTRYLTATAEFSDARNSCLSAAKDIFGENSTEYNAVKDGFTAVGITGSGSNTLELSYDDGNPSTGVYEPDANWELAVRFTPPVPNAAVTRVGVYYAGDNSGGNGTFKLTMYDSKNNGMPGSRIVTPLGVTPGSSTGWLNFNVTGLTVTGDFYVSVIYNGTNQTLIGGDMPPGNMKSYEFSPVSSSWSQLTSPNDFTLFMRARVTTATSVVDVDTKVPEKFEVMQNYPNPFNPSTTIKYSLPEARNVNITIYDMTGKQVAELVNNLQNPGTYNVTWNGMDNSGNPVSSGVYLYSIKAGSFQQTKKMMLMK